jgi:predicted permease
MLDFLHDLRFSRRLLSKSPGFTVVAVLTLALGIGANTAVFSIINGVLLRPLPYRDPERLVDVLDESGRESRLAKLFDSYRDYREYRQHAQTLGGVAAATWAVRGSIFSGHGATRRLTSIPVSENFFAVLGASAARGRTFSREDVGRSCSLVLSNGFWQGEFGGDPAVVGRSLSLDQRACTVVGVMPASFAFYPGAAQLWSLMPADLPDTQPVFILGRMKQGIARPQTESELKALHRAIHSGDSLERELAPVVDDLQEEFTWLAGRNLRMTLWALLASVALVLVIACLNVAGLLLGRGFARGRELAIRAALGGGRSRLVRQLLTEGLLLSAVGGGLGLFGADAALRAFRVANPVELPVGTEIGVSWPVLMFSVCISATATLLFGLAPAWRASHVDLIEALKSGGRGGVLGGGRHRMAKLLVAGEVALSVILLAGAGLLLESVARMGAAPLGFAPARLYATGLTLPSDRYKASDDRARFYDQLQTEVAAMPGVESVAISSALPPNGTGNLPLDILGRPVPPEHAMHDVGQQWTSAGYFHALGASLQRGRAFDARDRFDAQPVAIVDEALAREYFPNMDPIGQKIRVGDNRRAPWLTIVGIAATTKRATVYREMSWVESATVYRPLMQETPETVSIVVRTGNDRAPVASAIQSAVASLDSEVAVGQAEAIEQNIAKVLAYPKFRAVVLSAFAGFALLLAALGLHGVLSQLVTQRTQEIGVRMALGAQQRDVFSMVLRQGGAPVVAGLACGLGVTLGLTRFLEAFLYGVRPRDPITMAAVSLALLLVAVCAILRPARRAAHTHPMAALREE